MQIKRYRYTQIDSVDKRGAPVKPSRFFVKILRNEDGTVAIEFALLSIPFILVLVGIIEVAMMFTSAALLESATGTASRMIRTGQIQQATTDPVAQEAMFRDALCLRLIGLVTCEDVELEALSIGSFGGFGDYQPQYNADGDMQSRGFNAGGVSDVMMIRTSFRYEMLTPLIGQLLGQGGTNSQVFTSTVVLKTEPYEFEEE